MKTQRLIKKVLVYITGGPLLIIGLILIPLPGPGILITALALIILSTEINQLQPYRDQGQAKLKAWWDEYKQKQDEINRKYK